MSLGHGNDALRSKSAGHDGTEALISSFLVQPFVRTFSASPTNSVDSHVGRVVYVATSDASTSVHRLDGSRESTSASSSYGGLRKSLAWNLVRSGSTLGRMALVHALALATGPHSGRPRW